MPKYTYDHIHLRTREPQRLTDWFCDIFEARRIEFVQSNGVPRVDLDLDGLRIFVAQVAPDAEIASEPHDPHLGLDHFGLRVENVDESVAELRARGAEVFDGPRTIRPGVRIAFVRAPDDIRIELLQRDPGFE